MCKGSTALLANDFPHYLLPTTSAKITARRLFPCDDQLAQAKRLPDRDMGRSLPATAEVGAVYEIRADQVRIVIFANAPPDLKQMSTDRWNVRTTADIAATASEDALRAMAPVSAAWVRIALDLTEPPYFQPFIFLFHINCFCVCLHEAALHCTIFTIRASPIII